MLSVLIEPGEVERASLVLISSFEMNRTPLRAQFEASIVLSCKPESQAPSTAWHVFTGDSDAEMFFFLFNSVVLCGIKKMRSHSNYSHI